MTTRARPEPLSAEDEALIDRLAARVVELRMDLPAILALESGRPLGFLASQAMVFLEPFARSLFRLPDYRRFATLIERRDTIEKLVTRIETRADEADRERRAARAKDRERRKGAAPPPPDARRPPTP